MYIEVIGVITRIAPLTNTPFAGVYSPALLLKKRIYLFVHPAYFPPQRGQSLLFRCVYLVCGVLSCHCQNFDLKDDLREERIDLGELAVRSLYGSCLFFNIIHCWPQADKIEDDLDVREGGRVGKGLSGSHFGGLTRCNGLGSVI